MINDQKPLNDPVKVAERLQRLLDRFVDKLSNDEDVRARVQALWPACQELQKLGKSLLPVGSRVSARDRILEYFKRYNCIVVDKSELIVVSGISEWARRVRELRHEMGWKIFSGVTFKEMAEDDPNQIDDLKHSLGVNPAALKPSQYILVSLEQDREAAYRWKVLNEVRRKNVGVKTKILEFLLINVGKPVSGEELRYLAKSTNEWTRRVRELRTEEGWSVATRLTGRPELPVGTYVLENLKQAQPHDRKIKDDVRVAVLARDGHCCQFEGCAWKIDDARLGDPRHHLELHHIQFHRDRGANDEANLITLCNVHHDAVHRDESHRFS